MKRKRICALLLFLCACYSMCGFNLFLGKEEVILDTEKNPFYRSDTAEYVLSCFDKDSDPEAAAEKYKNSYVRLTGTVVSVDKKGSHVNIAGRSNAEKFIICDFPKELRSQAAKLKTGDTIAVSGKLTVDWIDKDIRIDADQFVSGGTPGQSLPGMLYTRDGSSYNPNSMSECKLNGGKIQFFVPAAWKDVECTIKEGNGGSIEGYQYSLNKLRGSSDVYHELFFVCYFDNSKLLESSTDRSRTAEIEKAIIRNISDIDPLRFPAKKVDTYYGAKYAYYRTSYKDALMGGEGYHVEYVFQQDGDQGIVVYLYVYKNTAHHLNDILFLMQSLKIK